MGGRGRGHIFKLSLNGKFERSACQSKIEKRFFLKLSLKERISVYGLLWGDDKQ